MTPQPIIITPGPLTVAQESQLIRAFSATSNAANTIRYHIVGKKDDLDIFDALVAAARLYAAEKGLI